MIKKEKKIKKIKPARVTKTYFQVSYISFSVAHKPRATYAQSCPKSPGLPGPRQRHLVQLVKPSQIQLMFNKPKLKKVEE